MSSVKNSRLMSSAYLLRRTLNFPRRILLICIIFFVLSVILNGSLFRIWGMQRDLVQVAQLMVDTKKLIQHLDIQLDQAKDPVFIERQARDKLDMVNEGDLVFVFSDGS